MENPNDLAQKLEKEGAKTLSFFQGVAEDNWALPVYSDGAAWTVRQLFAHIVEAEAAIAVLVKGIIGGAAGVPKDFDIDGYNERHVRQVETHSIEELLKLFKERRAETVRMVAAFSEGDLKKRGRHPFLGEADVVEIVRLMYLHVQLHIRDVRKAIRNNV